MGSPHRARETVQHARHQPAHAPADHDTSRRPAAFPPAGQADRRPQLDLAQVSGLDVVDGAADLAGEQVRALPDQPDRLPHVVVDVGERAGRPRRPPAGRLLDQVGEADVVGGLEPALGVVDQQDLAGAQHVLGDGQRADGVLGDDAAGVADDVGVADLEPEHAEQRHPRVHAGDHGHRAGRAHRLAAGELPRPLLVRRQHPVDLGHRASSSSVAPGPYPAALPGRVGPIGQDGRVRTVEEHQAVVTALLRPLGEESVAAGRRARPGAGPRRRRRGRAARLRQLGDGRLRRPVGRGRAAPRGRRSGCPSPRTSPPGAPTSSPWRPAPCTGS